jgi:hypothetical protein
MSVRPILMRRDVAGVPPPSVEFDPAGDDRVRGAQTRD